MILVAIVLLTGGAGILVFLAYSVLASRKPDKVDEILVQHREKEEEHVELDPVREDLPARQERPATLVVPGLLYLDHGRKLHRSRSLALSPASFQELKRIGNASLIIDGSTFIIHAENASYTYSSSDLDRVFFRDKGLALVPLSARRAVPVFLSEKIQEIKSYIKEHARIKSVA